MPFSDLKEREQNGKLLFTTFRLKERPGPSRLDLSLVGG